MLKQSLTYLLASIADEGIGHADRLFVERFGWTVRELRVLRLVRDRPGITFTELAALTRIERTATSRVVTRMVGAGLIRRAGSGTDARRFALTATAKGSRLCAKADPLSLELEALMLAPLTARQRRELVGAMRRVLAWVGDGYHDAVQQRFPEASAASSIRRRTAAR